ncbi:putative G-protein coupled receptor 133 [Stylophora pistillata]|uniref:Putative G-protein coupled receptor 133 n=1 Tax=Stylophora pistillata TaxID=50429 RepID=A0A2B4RSV3_STYPI|nr:putative G-protein coupled receptor 133 [Stylophora pistillata]
MQHTKVELSKEDHLALSIITYVGCGVSTGALIITIIVFLSVESLSSERHKIHTNLVVSLLLANVLFLAGIDETSSPVLCKVVAVSMHYFFLTAFTWMLVEGLHLYLKVVQVFRTENIKIAYYYVFGWGFSVLPVAITFTIKPNSYGSSEICWLSIGDGTIWAFAGPVVAIIAVNTFVLIMVIKTVVSSVSAVKSSGHADIKAGIKGLFVLMPLLGVGWILGLFALNDGTKVFSYAFAIVNGFQGLLIFLLHCVFNSEVRQAFRRQKEKHSLTKENLSQYNASFSLSQSDSESRKTSNFSNFDKLKAKISRYRKGDRYYRHLEKEASKANKRIQKEKSRPKISRQQPTKEGSTVAPNDPPEQSTFTDVFITSLSNRTKLLKKTHSSKVSHILDLFHLWVRLHGMRMILVLGSSERGPKVESQREAATQFSSLSSSDVQTGQNVLDEAQEDDLNVSEPDVSVSEELADTDNESMHGNESCSFSQVPADEPKMTKKAKISPQLVDNKRKQMEKALSQSKRDKILMNATKEDIIMKKQMISSLEESNESLQSVMQKMTESLSFMAERISAGMRMIATAMESPSQ